MISVGVIAGSGQGTFPSAVTSSATQTSYNSITLSWTAPFNGGAPIASYSYQVSTDNTNWGTAVNAGLVTSVVVGSLGSPGTTYYFRVLATNSIGSGPYGASCNAATAKSNTSISSSALYANFEDYIPPYNNPAAFYPQTITGPTDSVWASIYLGNNGPGATNYTAVAYLNGLTSQSGAALAGVTVNLYLVATGYNIYYGSTTTDGSGNASIGFNPANQSLVPNDLVSGLYVAPTSYYYWTYGGNSQYNGVTQSANRVGTTWNDWNS